CVAICAAVEPLPYRFDASFVPTCAAAVFELAGAHVTAEPLPPVVHDVSFDVLFVGFMPAVVAELALALPLFAELALADDVESLLWPGAFPEFPGEVGLGAGCAEVAWEFPLPLLASAVPTNALRTIISTAVPKIAAVPFVISFSPRRRTVYP